MHYLVIHKAQGDESAKFENLMAAVKMFKDVLNKRRNARLLGCKTNFVGNNLQKSLVRTNFCVHALLPIRAAGSGYILGCQRDRGTN